MLNAHNEAKNDDTEHDQEFHDVHGGDWKERYIYFSLNYD